MPFQAVSKKSGKTYFLHARPAGKITLYFFAGKAKEGAVETLPDGMEVIENARTGLPMLKRKAV